MGMEEEVVDPIELLTVHGSRRGQIQHPFEADRGFLSGVVAFSNQTRPHGIMEFWRGVGGHEEVSIVKDSCQDWIAPRRR
jgi:hypothetical protein